ncbi:MAG: type II secretion system protein GspG [Acidobacteriota bacterium]|nr:type II secretion system protein GspG [Acidobacteriota bacterium]
MADLRTIATAWEARATDVNKYNAAGACTLPSVVMSPGTMDSILSPTYIKVLPPKDGWGTPWEYRSDVTFGGAAAQQYAILSYGKDATAQSSPLCGSTTNFDCDIIYSQGAFLQYPEGVQQQ